MVFILATGCSKTIQRKVMKRKKRTEIQQTTDLAYIVEVERFKAKLGGREDVIPLAVRTTSILRPEDGTWKVVHRHADPITIVQAPESVIQK
jgi:ketosteroid isomerase-like protein